MTGATTDLYHGEAPAEWMTSRGRLEGGGLGSAQPRGASGCVCVARCGFPRPERMTASLSDDVMPWRSRLVIHEAFRAEAPMPFLQAGLKTRLYSSERVARAEAE